jgi:hypothetical protein
MPTRSASACINEVQRYSIDIDYLNTLVQRLKRSGLVLPGSAGMYFAPLGCITPCDREWLSTAILAAERILASGVRPSYSPLIPDNLCPR